MNFFIETAHGYIVEVVHHRANVAQVLKEMNERGQIPKRCYTLDSKGRKCYLKNKE